MSDIDDYLSLIFAIKLPGICEMHYFPAFPNNFKHMNYSDAPWKRQKKTWVVVDTGDKSADEYIESVKEDIFFVS